MLAHVIWKFAPPAMYLNLFFQFLRNFLPYLSLFLLATAWAQSDPASALPEATPQATRVVLGIIGYARWPVAPETYRVCTAGEQGRLHELFENPASIGEHSVVVVPLAGGPADLAAGCDVLYLGALPLGRRRQLLAEALGRPILTISEGDGFCANGTMFCLVFTEDRIKLQANLDSISRSGIRINPKVLQFTRRRPGPP